MYSVRNSIAKDSHTIQVWKISVDQNIEFLFSRYNDVLTKEELYKSKQFFQDKDRNNYLTRRIMSRLLFAQHLGCSPEEIEFREGNNKKPEISFPPTSLQFNLSHSGDYIAIAISHTPIGIDIEKINPHFQYQDIMDHYFTTDEQHFILENKHDALNNFFFLWTRKEAYVKYTAEGLLGNLMDMPKLINLPDNSGINSKENTRFCVKSTLLEDAYYMSLVYPFDRSDVQYFDYDHNTPISYLPLLLKA